MSKLLEGRTALVTGASRGIGFAIAEAFHREGARVALLARDVGAVRRAAARLSDSDDVLAVSADVIDDASVKDAVDEVAKWAGGTFDILVNSAGPQLAPAPLADTATDVLRSYLDVKLLGFHRIASASLPVLSRDGHGRIINIVGQTALTLVPNAGVTGITNAAVAAFSKYLAAEAAPDGILVNAISPGMTLTEGWVSRHEAAAAQQNKSVEDVRAALTANIGIRVGRWAEPGEIAAAALFLASDLSSYVSGSLIEVDGGLSKAVV